MYNIVETFLIVYIIYIFRKEKCFRCVVIYEKHPNVLQYRESKTIILIIIYVQKLLLIILYNYIVIFNKYCLPLVCVIFYSRCWIFNFIS